MLIVYVSRNEEGRGLASIEDMVDTSIQPRARTLHEKARRNTEHSYLNQYFRQEDQQKGIKQKQKWEEKQIYKRFKRQTSDFSYEKTWPKLRKEKTLERKWIPSTSSTKQHHKH